MHIVYRESVVRHSLCVTEMIDAESSTGVSIEVTRTGDRVTCSIVDHGLRRGQFRAASDLCEWLRRAVLDDAVMARFKLAARDGGTIDTLLSRLNADPIATD